MAQGNFFPLVDGATWTYRHTSGSLEVWDEVVAMRETTWQGGVAYETEDNADANGESTTSVHVLEGTAVFRVHKEVELGGAAVLSADYDPGFLRVDNAWVEGDSIVSTYQRTEYDASGTMVDRSPRNQRYTFESASVEVTVPAGTFDCIQFVRERIETGETKRFWFADGVGKVKHETLSTGSVEELSVYSL